MQRESVILGPISFPKQGYRYGLYVPVRHIDSKESRAQPESTVNQTHALLMGVKFVRDRVVCGLDWYQTYYIDEDSPKL